MQRKNYLIMMTVWTVLLFTSSWSLRAQDFPVIQTRFSNPSFDSEKRIYSVDVELQSKKQDQKLFGFNVRFYYNAEELTFQNFTEFGSGYDNLGGAPKKYKGNEKSGAQLFNFPGAATYVNGAVQLKDDGVPILIQKEGWAKIFRANFEVPTSIDINEDFCPSLIWDLKTAEGRGGFMPTVDGIVLTVLEENEATRQISAPTISAASQYNWTAYVNKTTFPYGSPETDQCISLNSVVSSDLSFGRTQAGYGLYQNQPNPFDSETQIRFRLPKAEKVKFSVLDAAGRTIYESTLDYNAGDNFIRLENQDLNAASNVLFYKIESASGFHSKILKMNLVNR